jgi:starch phosphorylase
MPNIIPFTVVPKLPEPIADLRRIAYNYHWCWEPEFIALFFRIDPDLWVRTNQNPVALLGRVGQARLEELSQDESFLAHLERVVHQHDEYMNGGVWADKYEQAPEDFRAAYFSLEFGIHESLSIYSGGLGLLAGDHLKSASDLGLPLTGVGLLYREGYHSQYLNADGWQQERYPRNDFYNMGVEPVHGPDGEQVTIHLQFPERRVAVRTWKVQVGRIPLYLLDCDFDANEPEDRQMTARLYGGDPDMRVRQEMLLGMGGVRLLRKLDLEPHVYHMNEGHAAFLTLERLRNFVKEDGLSIEEAMEAVKAASVFTTHTPVPAGNDMFNPEMIQHFFHNYCEEIGMSSDDLMALGRQDPKDGREPFCMTVLALRLSSAANGVSKLHGDTARRMWSRSWPGLPTEEVPITSITNGVHTRFWVSRDMASLFDRYLGPGWIANPADEGLWSNIDLVPDPELWRTHERRRERLVNFARRRLTTQLRGRGAPQAEIDRASEALDPEVLTIGFARRFATYKRATLFLRDADRFAEILGNADRPVQIILSGKAHPADNQAKELIRGIIHFIRRYDLRNRVAFIEDYDINVARYMVQGVDCWLNTPRRPLEASGTSGMKVAVNGGLNVSIPDGWWDEAAKPGENGWSIGRGETYDNPDEQDQVESETLYELLEEEIVPRFYERGRDGVPRSWVQMMKASISEIAPYFSTHRMVSEYTDRFYIPAALRALDLDKDDFKGARELAAWKRRVREAWPKVRLAEVHAGSTDALPFGTHLEITAKVQLSPLECEDVQVEVYYGELDPYDRILDGRTEAMECESGQGGLWTYRGAIPCDRTGRMGCTVRVVPSHNDLAYKHETALITWR